MTESKSPSMGGAGAVAARELESFTKLVLKSTKKKNKKMTEDQIEELIYPILFKNSKPDTGKTHTDIGFQIIDALREAGVLNVKH